MQQIFKRTSRMLFALALTTVVGLYSCDDKDTKKEPAADSPAAVVPAVVDTPKNAMTKDSVPPAHDPHDTTKTEQTGPPRGH